MARLRKTKVLNVKRLQQKLHALGVKAARDTGEAVLVGYFGVGYAVYVHENKEVHHPNGQAKFLEQPYREKAGEIAARIAKTAKLTGSLLKGLLVGGLFLQRESQKLVPVDTGHLKGSADTRKE